jgi:hypothetical protein
MLHPKRDEWSGSLSQVQLTLNKLEIPFFLDFGTLLGAARNGEFIPWDNDIDLGTLDCYLDEDKVVSFLLEMERNGYYGKLWGDTVFLFKDSTEISLKIYSENGPNYIGYFINEGPTLMDKLRVVSSIRVAYSSAMKTFCRRLLMYLIKLMVFQKSPKKVMLTIPKSLMVIGDCKLQICGTDYPVVDRFEDYLEFKYGKDWRTPKEDYNYLTDDGAISKW